MNPHLVFPVPLLPGGLSSERLTLRGQALPAAQGLASQGPYRFDQLVEAGVWGWVLISNVCDLSLRSGASIVVAGRLDQLFDAGRRVGVDASIGFFSVVDLG